MNWIPKFFHGTNNWKHFKIFYIMFSNKNFLWPHVPYKLSYGLPQRGIFGCTCVVKSIINIPLNCLTQQYYEIFSLQNISQSVCAFLTKLTDYVCSLERGYQPRSLVENSFNSYTWKAEVGGKKDDYPCCSWEIAAKIA